MEDREGRQGVTASRVAANETMNNLQTKLIYQYVAKIIVTFEEQLDCLPSCQQSQPLHGSGLWWLWPSASCWFWPSLHS